MGYKGNNGEYGVGYIAPSPPIGDKETGYKYFPGGPISSENVEKEMSKKQVYENHYTPSPKAHLIVSLIKSGVRIIGYLLLLGISSPWAKAAAVVLVISEAIGILEELV